MRLVFINFGINPINCGIRLILYDTLSISKSCQPGSSGISAYHTVYLSLVSYCAHTVQFPQWKENVTTRCTIGSDFHNGFAKDVNEGLSKILGGHFETFFERVKKI